MAKYRSVRVLTDGAVAIAQLEGLRAVFPSLSKFPPADLGARLSAWPICVVGAVPVEEAPSAVERLAALGLGVELFDIHDYTAEYVRGVVPPPRPEWGSAVRSLELVFRPSFSPEVVLRLWQTDRNARLQLASLNASIWTRRFNPPPWLPTRTRRVVLVGGRAKASAAVEEPEIPREHPTEEFVEVGPIDDVLALAAELRPAEPDFGLDGMFVHLTARTGSRSQAVELWSPSPDREPKAFELLYQVHRLAWTSLEAPESRRRLEELHWAIGLGPRP